MTEDWQEWWAERAAILEYDAGMRRDHAEAMAHKLVRQAMFEAAQRSVEKPSTPLPASASANKPDSRAKTAQAKAEALKQIRAFLRNGRL